LDRRGAATRPDLSDGAADGGRTRTDEARYFDGLIGREGDFNPFTDRGWRALARSFERMIGAPARGRLLDVGCGTGQSHRVYGGSELRYAGADLSIGALARAGQRLPQQQWLAADAAALPLRDGVFDFVCFSSVLHHLPAPVEALREARRALVPGGWVFAFDPNLLHPPMALFRHPSSPLYSSAGVSPNERPVLPREVCSWFGEAGFDPVKQICRSGIAYRRVAPRLFDRLLPFYNLADAALQAIGLGRWLGSFVLTAASKV
jgi:SAM-dependent methyltransferase